MIPLICYRSPVSRSGVLVWNILAGQGMRSEVRMSGPRRGMCLVFSEQPYVDTCPTRGRARNSHALGLLSGGGGTAANTIGALW